MPGFAGDDGLALLDLGGAQVHVEVDAAERDDDSGGVVVGMGAAGFAANRFSRNSRALEFFAQVSREFQLADVECGKRQFDGSRW